MLCDNVPENVILSPHLPQSPKSRPIHTMMCRVFEFLFYSSYLKKYMLYDDVSWKWTLTLTLKQPQPRFIFCS